MKESEDVYDNIYFHFYIESKKDPSQLVRLGTSYEREACSSLLENEGIAVTGVMAHVDADEYAEDARCYLTIDSSLATRHDLKVEVYPLENVRRYLGGDPNALGDAVTNKVLNISYDDIEDKKIGKDDVYSGVFTLDHLMDTALCLVYSDAAPDRILSCQGFTFTLTDKDTAFDGNIYAWENGEMVSPCAKAAVVSATWIAQMSSISSA